MIRAKAMSLRAIRGTQRLPVLDVDANEAVDGAPQHVTINVLVMPQVHVVVPAASSPALPEPAAARSFRRQLAAYDAPADADAVRTFKTVG